MIEIWTSCNIARSKVPGFELRTTCFIMIRYDLFFHLQKAYAMQVCTKLFVPAVTAVIFLGCRQQISASKTNRVLTCSAV